MCLVRVLRGSLCFLDVFVFMRLVVSHSFIMMSLLSLGHSANFKTLGLCFRAWEVTVGRSGSSILGVDLPCLVI